MNKQSGLSPQINDLLRILEISRHQAMTIDLQSLLAEIEIAASEILNCDRATVFVYDSEHDELYSCVESRAEFVHIRADQGIAGASFQSGLLLNIQDAYADPRFNPDVDRETGFRTRNMLVSPLVLSNNENLGVIEVLNKHHGDFTSHDELLLETFAAQSAVSLHRQFLMEEFGEQKRLQSELAIAKQIQRGLLPKASPELQGFEIAGWNQPAEETSGDFYDFQRLKDEALIFIIADVAGHGVGPALLAAQCSALQRAVFSMGCELEESLTRINQLLCEDIPSDRFATAFLGRVDAAQNRIQATSAGHEPVYIYRAANRAVEQFAIGGPPLGIIENCVYDEWQTIRLEKDDILVALTDGFLEAEDCHGNRFGSQGIADAIKTAASLSAENIIEFLRDALTRHIQGTRQADDLTAIVIKKTWP
ncbi:MAG: PP2C family protein-serine/threonine phosphatase [Gammaproteobacteria bacterium]